MDQRLFFFSRWGSTGNAKALWISSVKTNYKSLPTRIKNSTLEWMPLNSAWSLRTALGLPEGKQTSSGWRRLKNNSPTEIKCNFFSSCWILWKHFLSPPLSQTFSLFKSFHKQIKTTGFLNETYWSRITQIQFMKRNDKVFLATTFWSKIAGRNIWIIITVLLASLRIPIFHIY